MESKHLSYFKVENFKRFDSLEVKDIAQFNLIVGDNNVGKTSLLEALLFDDEDYDVFLDNLLLALDSREIEINTTQINYLNFYFNDLNKPLTYTYRYSNNNEKNELKLIERLKNELTKEEIENLGAHLRLYNSNHLVKFSLNNTDEIRLLKVDYDTENSYFPFISFKMNYEGIDIELFSKISLSTQKLEKLKKEMEYFVPNLTSIEINNAIIPKQLMIAIRESTSDVAKPLTQYGDGALKLFRYLLEFEFCETGRLMIDEIDAGIHYSRMKDFLKKVLQSAKNKNVQIFATTHSKECLGYYTQALQELGFENDGRIIRIANTKSGIKAYTIQFDEFESALYAENEIR